jgi:outer membrane protein assembly factor BamB
MQERGAIGATGRPGTARLVACALVAGASLAGCGWFGGDDEIVLEGERIPILVHERQVRPDAALASLQVVLPRPVANTEWAQPGGVPSHAMQHPAIADELKRAWSVDVGEGASDKRFLLSSPVVADGRVFTMDADTEVTALDAESGKKLWSAELMLEEEEGSAVGGGIAYQNGRLFVTTGFAQVIALDAESGEEIWRQSVPGPARAAPTVAAERVFVVTIDNQLHALDFGDGHSLWTHSGIVEIAGLLGGASPAVEKGVVVVPYSSGELYALRVANGRMLWSDNLSPVRRSDVVSLITAIRGLPVIDGGRVYAISHGGRMVAIDMRSGQRVWDKTFGGMHAPWVVGDYIYVLTIGSELVCLTRKDGRIRWVVALRPFEDMANKEDPIYWLGPVLAGDRLIVTGSHGEALAISPYTGELLGKLNLPDPVAVMPVVANGTIYFLTDDAELIALR